MQSTLILQDLWQAIEDKFAGSVTEEQRLMIKGAISMSVTDSVLREIAGEDTATKAWKKLEELYLAKSLTNRLYLNKRLYNLRMIEGTMVKSYLDEFNSIIMNLKNVDIKIEDEDQAVIVLCSLSPSYDTSVDSMLYGKESISLDDVSSALKSKELKKSFPDNKAEAKGGASSAKAFEVDFGFTSLVVGEDDVL
ncbi:Retrovirus-related Pol polyprotein from transposon TNT 1-94 [Senna tora]|uniref:Retrovirus-related Pol polyprotein from transposon TNT 1-94 n=1 Tax=Senna tora TaxID=362788 RepID=A0A834WFE8_9FABA|nr:Retrovirus-related Pol polyprotein from transposon TNT 1-94 [Senna tora]